LTSGYSIDQNVSTRIVKTEENMLFPFDAGKQSVDNPFMAYLREQDPEALAAMAQEISPEVRQAMSGSLQGVAGALPPEQFAVHITTSRENLLGLLSSAMMTGYFLHNLEQRYLLEHRLTLEAAPESES
jgi:Protein of unknown function (DUF760)